MNKLLLIILGILLLLGGFLFVNTTSQTNTNMNGKLSVTTSFYPLYFFSSQIGGDKADVQNITPAGSEPHDYEPTAKDMARIEHANLLVLNGNVESWGDKIKNNLQGKATTVIVAGEGLFTKTLTEEGETMRDPHVWLNPILAKKEVEKITKGYTTTDPLNKAYYEANEKQLTTKLDKLDAKYQAGLQNCQTRDIITSHEAFAYLAEQYGLNQVAIAGLSPDEEPSSKQLAEVADFAKQNNTHYIFFETLVSPKLAETIAQEIGAQTLVLDPIEGLSDDDIKQGKNYFTVMEDNLKNLQTALQCK